VFQALAIAALIRRGACSSTFSFTRLRRYPRARRTYRALRGDPQVNIAKLFIGASEGGGLTHLRSASSRTTRTREELRKNIANLGHALCSSGIRPGDAVLLLSGSRVEIAEAILACFYIGATAVPLSPLLGTDHMLSVIGKMRPACCLFEDDPEPPIRDALTAAAALMISLKSSGPPAPGQHFYRDLIAHGPAVCVFPDHADGHPALVLHGSGSSGNLKAVMMTQGALLRFFEYHNFIYTQYSDAPDALTGSGALLTGLPLTHLAGLALCLLGLMNGRQTFLMSFFLPRAYLRIVEEVRCPYILLVPSLYRALLKEPVLRHIDRSALRFCIAGGEPCPEELAAQIEAAFGVPLVTTYGMTECLSGIGHLRRDLFAGRLKPQSCGRQLFGEVSLRDSSGREQPDFGELWVRNATVHRCYLEESLNQERLRAGWFRTGDLFHRDADGDFFYRGRVDDMFICNGKNIYPLEIERLLMRHPAVESVCAAPVTLLRKGVVPGALVVCRERVSEAEIQEFAMKHGPSHAIPQVVCFADRIPLIGPGKVDRPWVIRLLQDSCTRVPGEPRGDSFAPDIRSLCDCAAQRQAPGSDRSDGVNDAAR
jgi:long-chain acyl-CoA synthetase